MSHRLITLTIAAVVLLALTAAQGADLDGDGLYDVEDYAADWCIDLGSVTGTADFFNQGIEDLDGTSSLINATELTLALNAITSIEAGDFSGLSSLQALALTANAITSIESGDFSGLSNLQGLLLGGNAITSIESGRFTGLSNLQELYLNYNAITSIESGILADMSSLYELNLGYNAITSIESGSFADMSNLQTLVLNHNAITSIESGAFADVGTLQSLFLDSNALTQLNFTAANLPSLMFLGADTAEITGLVLDDAVLSQMSFWAILFWTTDITEASLVGTDLGDTASLSPLLNLSLLGTLAVDAALYAAWQSDLDTWDALAGHDLTVMGEFDGDGNVDDIDIDLLADAIRTGSTNFALFDLSGDGVTHSPDGVIDQLDLDYLVRFLVETSMGLGTEYGDFNLDGLIDTTDLTRLATDYGTGDTWAEGNANRNIDLTTDTTDLTILATYYGAGVPDAVPEPASAVLFVLAGLTATVRRRRPKR